MGDEFSPGVLLVLFPYPGKHQGENTFVFLVGKALFCLLSQTVFCVTVLCYQNTVWGNRSWLSLLLLEGPTCSISCIVAEGRSIRSDKNNPVWSYLERPAIKILHQLKKYQENMVLELLNSRENFDFTSYSLVPFYSERHRQDNSLSWTFFKTRKKGNFQWNVLSNLSIDCNQVVFSQNSQ